jgi:hypothetical protein
LEFHFNENGFFSKFTGIINQLIIKLGALCVFFFVLLACTAYGDKTSNDFSYNSSRKFGGNFSILGLTPSTQFPGFTIEEGDLISPSGSEVII